MSISAEFFIAAGSLFVWLVTIMLARRRWDDEPDRFECFVMGTVLGLLIAGLVS